MVIHPFEKEPDDSPPGVSPHLDVRLKPGWRFDRRRRALVSEAGDSIGLRGLLPSGTKIVAMVPALAEADSRGMSDDERLLARYLQAVLPPGSDTIDAASVLQDLQAVELVSVPPRIGLA